MLVIIRWLCGPWRSSLDLRTCMRTFAQQQQTSASWSSYCHSTRTRDLTAHLRPRPQASEMWTTKSYSMHHAPLPSLLTVAWVAHHSWLPAALTIVLLSCSLVVPMTVKLLPMAVAWLSILGSNYMSYISFFPAQLIHIRLLPPALLPTITLGSICIQYHLVSTFLNSQMDWLAPVDPSVTLLLWGQKSRSSNDSWTMKQ